MDVGIWPSKKPVRVEAIASFMTIAWFASISDFHNVKHGVSTETKRRTTSSKLRALIVFLQFQCEMNPSGAIEHTIDRNVAYGAAEIG